MFGFTIDALDPTLVAVGMVIGSAVTAYIMKRVARHDGA